MSHREFMIVLAHAQICGACRTRLLVDPTSVTATRALAAEEKQILNDLKAEHFIAPDALTRAAGCSAEELDAFCNQPVVRLRHL